ncbi:MAG: LL-diaminopimelate aminotransferase [Phycisphaerae bacterium]|nr:LL-diaminopimelate aminotransferase [Phycisphaerae bacterium]
MSFQPSKRLQALPPYLFIEIDRRKREAIAAGKDVINLGVGDPDQPTPEFIRKRMVAALDDPRNHRYPFDEGVPEFRQQAASFMKQRFGVDVDWQSELITLIGSKEGLGHLPVAVVNPGDIVLVPQPGYPVYQAASILTGGVPYHMPLTEGNGWMPDLGAIPGDVAKKASLMFLNYPNNPTSACATPEFFAEAVAFAKANDIVIAQDEAYSELYFDQRPISILEVPGAKDVAIEFHSLSKTFNMTGWRLGWAVGNRDIVSALAKVKGNMDSGQFNAIQQAGQEALAHVDHVEVKGSLDVYRERRDVLVDGLGEIGFDVKNPEATFYVWAKCPKGLSSMDVAGRVLDEASVVLIPGIGFGEPGEGYVRAALTVGVERLAEAVRRMASIDW